MASRIVRESTLAATWKAIRAGMFALMTPGDDVNAGPLRRHDAMDAGGSRHLGYTGNGHFHIGGSNQHQVGNSSMMTTM
jgi:hypothetical protein